VLAPRIVRKYALSKGFIKGLQGVRNAYYNRSGNYFVLAVKVLAPKGRIKLVISRELVLKVAIRC
jgi:hypothetical protein